jgi:hypothetical protein
MVALVWAGLGVFVLAIVAGAAFAAARGFEPWGTLNAFRTRRDAALAETTERAGGIEARVGRLTESAQRLEAARARLQQSLRTLSTLSAALGEARALVASVTSLRR